VFDIVEAAGKDFLKIDPFFIFSLAAAFAIAFSLFSRFALKLIARSGFLKKNENLLAKVFRLPCSKQIRPNGVSAQSIEIRKANF
jgi:hypothetical protein